MRTSLIGSLVANIRYNQARKVPRIRVFEVGRVFLRDAGVKDGPLSVGGLRQPVRIAAAAYGPAEQWDAPPRPVDFYDVKADLEGMLAPLAAQFEPAAHPAFHPGRSARVVLDGAALGWIGELHPKWQQVRPAPAARAVRSGCRAAAGVPLPQPEIPSDQPIVLRDIALLFDADPCPGGFDALRAEKPAIVRAVRLFSLYRGAELPAGKKSLALRVVMQDTERTLTDAEADAARDALVALLGRKFSATLRT